MSRPLPKLYRNFSIVFLSSSLILLFIFLFTMVGSAKIIITPEFQDIEANLIVDVRESPFENTEVSDDTLVVDGKIFEFPLSLSQRFDATGEKSIESDVVGKVTIINNYSKEQTLIETTRLSTLEGVIVRIKEGITIQPGEQIEVSVYPDNRENFKKIEPTKFTIPGLWEGLRLHIYGESKTPLEAGGFKVKYISDQDIKTAQEQMRKLLDQKALEEFDLQLADSKTFYSKLVQKELLSENISAKAGEEKDSFQIDLEMHTAVIAFDEIKLVNLVKKNMAQGITAGKSLKDVDAENMQYSVQKYDPQNKLAHIKVTATGKSVIRVESELLDKKSFSGMTGQEIIEKLEPLAEIQNVVVQFSPGWVKNVPRFAERVEIIIE